jgi:molecular chaperone Hsp33
LTPPAERVSEPTSDPDIEVRTYFARGRNALISRGDFSEIFAAWYLHRMDHGIEIPAAMEDAAREAIASITLHSASRPWKEACAWTVKFPEPRLNVFAAADNHTGSVIANFQTSDLQPIGEGMFYADVVEDSKPPRRSVVDFREKSFLRAVEIFYSQSEQRLVRFFWHGEEDLVMVAAQPDCDEEWLAGLTQESIHTLDRDVELSLLEKRQFTFRCGCNQERMLDFMAPVFQRQADELFHSDPSISVLCPRCGARHILTREALEARTTKPSHE